LTGYKLESERIERAIAKIEARLKGARLPARSATPATGKPKRKLSAAARKRIAAAQKKRWATFHKAKAETA
jgi:hypothetical protein